MLAFFHILGEVSLSDTFRRECVEFRRVATCESIVHHVQESYLGSMTK